MISCTGLKKIPTVPHEKEIQNLQLKYSQIKTIAC